MTGILSKTTAALFVFACLGCNQPTAGSSENSLLDPSSSSNKVQLDDATHDQLAEHVSECQGHKLCVEICHRPPGNPENSKTMLLPLKASFAHLNHGGPHILKDYLGACNAEDGDDSTNDGAGDGIGDNNDEANGDNDTPPTWCQVYYDIDHDCDGFDDDTGESLF